MRTLLIFDFDRTLFNLTEFLRDLQRYVWELPPVPGDELAVTNKTLELFLNPQHYSDAEHLRLWLAPKLLPRSDYAYADALALLASLPANITPTVVTHGISEHKQYFKRWFAPSLQYLPFNVTDDNKGLLLSSAIKPVGERISVELPQSQGVFDRIVLVDDNPISFEPLVANRVPIEMMHLARPNEPHTNKPVAAGVRSITSLDELAALIR